MNKLKLLTLESIKQDLKGAAEEHANAQATVRLACQKDQTPETRKSISDDSFNYRHEAHLRSIYSKLEALIEAEKEKP